MVLNSMGCIWSVLTSLSECCFSFLHQVVYTCIHTGQYTHVYTPGSIYMYIHRAVYTCIYTGQYIHAYTPESIYMYIYRAVYTCIYTREYIHVYIPGSIYMYIHRAVGTCQCTCVEHMYIDIILYYFYNGAFML